MKIIPTISIASHGPPVLFMLNKGNPRNAISSLKPIRRYNVNDVPIVIKEIPGIGTSFMWPVNSNSKGCKTAMSSPIENP
ncbi:hypothetical protein, partial [Ferruginibacter sp.]|uniref:hypothetical protein n=1 Tax=Ferruginibacter sp. TaxID=1940288 RepID=UPI002658638E